MTLRELLKAYDINPEEVLETVVGIPDLPQPGRIAVGAHIEALEMRLDVGIHLHKKG
jgi:hypothetical protein